MSAFSFLKKQMIFHRRKHKWRESNAHNHTYLDDRCYGYDGFDPNIVSVGRETYGPIFILNASSLSRVRIGNYCSIADEVTFVVNEEHPISHVSTFPFKYWSTDGEQLEALSKGGIIVDDDVWIGYRATILDGVHLGQGCVIAAGAVVTKDVEPYTIVGGVPAKPIRRRLPEDLAELAMQIDYSNLDLGGIDEVFEDLYTAPTVSSIERLIKFTKATN